MVRLVGTDTKTIEHSVIDLIENPNVYAEMAGAHNLYGDSCQQIIDFFEKTHAIKVSMHCYPLEIKFI